MSPRGIRAARLAPSVAPRLWAFAYPFTGRGWRPLRWWAFRLWAWWFGQAWERAEREHWR